jgi:hypothetical protein
MVYGELTGPPWRYGQATAQQPGRGPDGPFADVSSRRVLLSPLADLLVELDGLCRAKNSGYAGDSPADPWSNYRSATRLGFTALDSALLRLEEKHNRFGVLWRRAGRDLVGESLRETLMDSAAIALIAVALLDERAPQDPAASWCEDDLCWHQPIVHTVGMHPTMNRNLADTGRPGVGGS